MGTVQASHNVLLLHSKAKAIQLEGQAEDGMYEPLDLQTIVPAGEWWVGVNGTSSHISIPGMKERVLIYECIVEKSTDGQQSDREHHVFPVLSSEHLQILF